MTEGNKSDEQVIRDLLKPRRAPPSQHGKSRQWVTTEKDVRAFTRIIREKFPTVIFLYDEILDEVTRQPVQIEGFEHGITKEVYAVIPDGTWDPEKYFGSTQPLGVMTRPRRHFNMFVFTSAHKGRTPDGRTYEDLGESLLRGYFYKSDRDQIKFLASVWRAVGKLSTQTIKHMNFETGQVCDESTKRGWYGFDALRWCQESEDRVLLGCDRPTDDWTMPDSPYYD